jgi:hypothetical protein
MRRAVLTVGAAILASNASAQQPPPDGVRIVTGNPLPTLPPPRLPSSGGSGSLLKPWLAPPEPISTTVPGTTPPTQTPQVAPLPVSAPVARFDNSSLRVKADNGRWQLWAGNQMLKDFGPAEREASEALQVFRDLRVNSHGSIGPVFEYWLADGDAPSALTRHRQVIPVDPGTLRVEQLSGQWVLRDRRTVLFNFGQAGADAQQALAVCKRYEFDQLGYVGHPTPSLKYLMRDPDRKQRPAVQDTLVPASAAMTAAEVAPPRLTLPGVGDVGDRVRLGGRLDLRHDAGEWVLYAGRTPVNHFGAGERDARMALQALEQFRVTELCRFGDSGFAFFLSNGRAPQGTIVGTASKPLRSDALDVRQVSGNWAICEGSRPLITFGDHAAEAGHALAAIREFHFDHMIPIGNGRSGNIYLFVKTCY